jgi:hypothetical protein
MKASENNNWLDDALANAVGSEKREPDFEKWRREHPDAVEALTAANKRIRGRVSIAKIVLHSRIAKLAAAAVVIIAAIFLVRQIIGPVDGTAFAFADVLNSISKARTVIYKDTFQTDEVTYVDEKMVNESGIMRALSSNGNIQIFNFAEGVTLNLSPSHKTATVTHGIGLPKRERFSYIDWIRTLHERQGVFAGQEEIDGKGTNKFICNVTDFFRITVWVDRKTNLPVRVEELSMPVPNKDVTVPHMSLSAGDFGGDSNEERAFEISGDGITNKSLRIMSDFVWDVELDESLFNLTPPEGYVIEEKKYDASEPSERDLVEALAFWTEMSEGTFPDTINKIGDKNDVKPMLVKKFHTGLTPKEDLEQTCHMMNVILRGLYFAQKQKVNNNWHYEASEAKFGDSEKPVCWWKKEGSDQFRVIYGNLSIGDANENELPKAP